MDMFHDGHAKPVLMVEGSNPALSPWLPPGCLDIPLRLVYIL